MLFMTLGNFVDTQIAFISLIISILSFMMSFEFWKKQFRPIITISVRTVNSGNVGIVFLLKVLNSGSIPAKNVIISIDEKLIADAFGSGASEENKERWVRSINNNKINILQNGEAVTCSFGTCHSNDLGFWKYNAEFPITINYQGWFGYKYTEKQTLQIKDSDSFTGYMWGENA